MDQLRQYFIGNNNYYIYYVIEDNDKGKLCFSKNPIEDDEKVYKFTFKINRKIKYPNLYFKADRFIRGDYFYTFNFEFQKDNQKYIIVPYKDESGNVYLKHEIETENIYPEDIYSKLEGKSIYEGIKQYINDSLNSEYEEKYDLNSDGIINTEDIIISERENNDKFSWIIKDIGDDESIYPTNKNDYFQIIKRINSIKFKNIILLDRETDRNYSLNIDNKNEFCLGNIMNLNLSLTHNAVKTILDIDDNLYIEGIYANDETLFDEERSYNIRIEEYYNNDYDNGYNITTNIHYDSVEVSEENDIIYINII